MNKIFVGGAAPDLAMRSMDTYNGLILQLPAGLMVVWSYSWCRENDTGFATGGTAYG